jgi:hypothetical protein
MKTIYETALEKIREGARFRIDFPNRSLKVNGKLVIDGGKFEGELGVDLPAETEETLELIEHLYDRFRHSVPSERTDHQKKTYFSALPEHELEDDDMIFGERRETAQFALEFHVLAAIIESRLDWDSFAAGKWFWQSPRQNGLVIMKSWVVSATANQSTEQ